MSTSKDAVIALLSSDSWLNRDAVRTLQENLHSEEFTANSARYPTPDGVMGPLTRSDVIDFITENPETLLTMSDESMIYFQSKGLGDELQAIVDENPQIREALIAETQNILNGRNVDALNGTEELRQVQTKLTLIGEYTGRIDGLTGKLSRGAVTSLTDEFAAAAAPAPEADTPSVEAAVEAVDLASIVAASNDTVASTTTAAPSQSQTELYMTALGFRDEGLERGDGGERNWNNKRDPEIWNLQVMLNRAGADIAVDADYGPGTQRAVRAFQEGHGLPATGQADYETLTKLASLPETQFSAAGQDNPREYTTIEHHKIIADILPQVTQDTGVSGGYLEATRGKETHFGVDFDSGTGSEGPYQITGGTFRGLINNHGEEIAQNLRDIGQDELADAVLESKNGRVDEDLRYDPYVATYAAAYYTVERGINTMNPDNWGRAYAAHNVGGGGYGTLRSNMNTPNVGAILDAKYNPDPARNNPSFFRNGATGAQALGRYQRTMETWSSEYEIRVQPQLDALTEMQALEAAAMAANITAPALETGKPF